jgi:hypothetical protein
MGKGGLKGPRLEIRSSLNSRAAVFHRAPTPVPDVPFGVTLSRLAPRMPALLGSLATGGLRRMASDETAKEFRAHEGSYRRFTFMMKWGTILSLLTGFIVILIIAK